MLVCKLTGNVSDGKADHNFNDLEDELRRRQTMGKTIIIE